MDTVSKQRRSEIMRGIRGDELLPEKTMHRALRSLGMRPARNPRHLPGKPDFWWPRKRVALFVDGCLWHACPRHWKCPKTNSGFWESKIRANVARDLRNAEALKRVGILVLRVWECALMADPKYMGYYVNKAVSGNDMEKVGARFNLGALYGVPKFATEVCI